MTRFLTTFGIGLLVALVVVLVAPVVLALALTVGAVSCAQDLVDNPPIHNWLLNIRAARRLTPQRLQSLLRVRVDGYHAELAGHPKFLRRLASGVDRQLIRYLEHLLYHHPQYVSVKLLAALPERERADLFLRITDRTARTDLRRALQFLAYYPESILPTAMAERCLRQVFGTRTMTTEEFQRRADQIIGRSGARWPLLLAPHWRPDRAKEDPAEVLRAYKLTAHEVMAVLERVS